MSRFTLYTDGGCHPNPGPGGWAFILKEGDAFLRQGSGKLDDTTSARTELTAALKGLEAVPEGASVLLVSDSQYLVKGLSEWRWAWKRAGWRNANGDLWESLDALADARQLTCEWVRGHSGCPENEDCDRLASSAYRS